MEHSRSTLGWKALLFLARWFIFLCLGTAAVAKLLAFAKFHDLIWDSHLIPFSVVYPVAGLIIAVELFIALGMVIPRFRAAALVLCGGLGMLFTSYAFWRISQGIGAPCSCFGTLLSLAPIHSMLLGLGLTGAAFLLAFGQES